MLVQAKKKPKAKNLSTNDVTALKKQCEKMLNITPAAYVFNYEERTLKVGSANRILGSNFSNLSEHCKITPYRFFYEFFRCLTGDNKITTALFRDLLSSEHYIENTLEITVLDED